MGSAASTLPATIDKATAQQAAGEKFDEDAFDKMAVNGLVSHEQFLAAAEPPKPPPILRTSSCKKMEEVASDEKAPEDFEEEAEPCGAGEGEGDKTATGDQNDDDDTAGSPEAQTATALPATAATPANAAEARAAMTETLRKRIAATNNGDGGFMLPTDERFFHGWAFEGPIKKPKVLWKSNEPPRKDHAGNPPWLTATEYEDEADVTAAKLAQLVELMRLSRHTVVYSGAGISASAVGQAALSGAITAPDCILRLGPPL